MNTHLLTPNMKLIIINEKSYILEAAVNYADYDGACRVEMVHAYDWYDQQMLIDSCCTIRNGQAKIELPDTLESGLYLLCSVTVNEADVILGKREQEGFSIITGFYIGRGLDAPQQVLLDSYMRAVERREQVFSEIKGDHENGTTYFDCYVFVKNMNVDTIIQYGDIEVIPFNRYKALSESKMIDAFFTSEGVPFDYSSNLSDGYGAVIYMRNVLSDEKGDYAKRLIREKAGILVNLFSLSNHDNCHIISTVIHDLKAGVYSININDPHYHGNLLRLSDQGFAIREEYKYLSENHTSLNVFIKLFNEAEVESDVLASYFRFWTLLEVMAEAHEIKGENMVRWDGSTVLANNGRAKTIETSIDAVFELIRRNYSANNTRDFIKLSTITNVKEFLSVCYRRRCCYAHKGGCNADNEAICNSNDESIRRCKSCLEINRGKVNDAVLFRLEQLVRELIYMEIANQIPDYTLAYFSILLQNHYRSLHIQSLFP